MSEKEKKEWVDPELIVIVRCKPEESVLYICKASRFACGDGNGPLDVIAAS